MQGLTIYALPLGILGLIIAYIIYLYVKKQPNGTPLMQELEGMIHSGAMAFLKREYSVLVFFIAAVFVLLLIFISWRTAVAFVTGAFCSMLAGFSGMTAATRGNSRTAEAANKDGQATGRNHYRQTTTAHNWSQAHRLFVATLLHLRCQQRSHDSCGGDAGTA